MSPGAGGANGGQRPWKPPPESRAAVLVGLASTFVASYLARASGQRRLEAAP